ncbi:YciI family protein [Mucilaginibacter sp. McL0603]|uniref:YciI family protein n=1 Tax=Mucilaginibacter sp. McL0603 TaxID=3415670 RepID=UPI003CFBB8BE
MPHYFLKLNPCRPTFAQDMTDAERAIMQQHVTYWGDLMSKGMVVVYGPVMDPSGAYGIGVVETKDEEQLKELIKNDPATTINNYQYYQMRAIVPAK